MWHPYLAPLSPPREVCGISTWLPGTQPLTAGHAGHRPECLEKVLEGSPGLRVGGESWPGRTEALCDGPQKDWCQAVSSQGQGSGLVRSIDTIHLPSNIQWLDAGRLCPGAPGPLGSPPLTVSSGSRQDSGPRQALPIPQAQKLRLCLLSQTGAECDGERVPGGPDHPRVQLRPNLRP